MPIISAILLAAGSSRRMGDTNKLLLPVHGKPMVIHSLEQIIASTVNEVIVVLGHSHDTILKILKDYQVKLIVNPTPDLGLTSSIKTGVASCTEKSMGFIICMADMPEITTTDYDYIIDVFLKSNCSNIIVPTFHGQNGNPVVFPSVLKDDILQHEAPNGCRGILKANKALVQTLSFPNGSILQDIDEMNEYKEWKKNMDN